MAGPSSTCSICACSTLSSTKAAGEPPKRAKPKAFYSLLGHRPAYPELLKRALRYHLGERLDLLS
jgi:hypothetical protein